jgi:hypothetical protein
MQKLEKIFIADLGLSSENRETIMNISTKIEIINTEKNIESTNELFSKGWIDAVTQKTSTLQMLVDAGHTPIIMLDSDTLIIEDFSEVINPDCDIQVCKRTNPIYRSDGFRLDYIASFVVINNIGSSAFIVSWINRLNERINQNMIPPHETPAMIETINKNTTLTIGFLDDKIVSCENAYFPGITKIIHAKSRNKKDRISIFRFANIKKLPYKKTINLIDSNKRIKFTIIYVFKKIFSLFEFKQFIKKITKTVKKKLK